MKREFLAAVLLMAVTASVMRADGTNAASTDTNAPAPKLQFDKTVYDFGPTSLVDAVTGTFTFQNAGMGELKIQKPQPSCGCTVASVKPDVLKPGEKGELIFTVRVAGQRGQLEKHITVPSNDPQASKVNLAIKVEMKQVLEVSPQNINLGNVRQGTITNVTVMVHRTDGKALNITKAEPSVASVRAHVEPISGSNGQSVKMTVEIEAEGTPRPFNDNVKLYLDDIPQPVSTVTVNGRLLGDVTVDPAMLYFPITDTSATNSEALPARRVTLSATRPDAVLNIKNLATNLKDLNLELVTVDTGKTYVVVAKFSEIPKQSVQGTITLETNTSTQPKLTIPVTVTVLKK